MSDDKESSVMFSIKELMSLEKEREQEQETERAEKAAAAERARVEGERAAREAEQARLRAEEERRRADELREREEAARLEAIRHAELERTRLEAAQRAKIEEMAVLQKLEADKRALDHDKSKKRLSMALFGGGAVALLLIGGIGFSFWKAQTERAQSDAITRAQLQQMQERANKLEQEIEAQRKKEQELQSRLASAKDDATRAEVQRQLDAERAKTDTIRRQGPGKGPANPAKPCNCAPGDPLCSCL